MMPAAQAGVGMIACPAVTGVVPHVGGPILPPGVPTVLVGKMPAVPLGNPTICTGGGIPGAVIRGSSKVMVGMRPMARVADTAGHGGLILPPGAVTVLVGG